MKSAQKLGAAYLAMKLRGITNVQMHVLCPAFIKTEIHLSDKHRPERYAMDDDPYENDPCNW